MKAIEIIAFPRLHISLIGMNTSGYRVNGGFGFSINIPTIKLNISESTRFVIEDNREIAFSKTQYNRLEKCIDKIIIEKKFANNIKIKIDGKLLSHKGFGSGTIIRLACVEALCLLNNFKYSIGDIISLSGRGGTSGVGIRTYFFGGYVLDIGRKNLDKPILPSNLQELETEQSLLIERGDMPDWEIGICVPNNLNTITEQQEKDFFDKNPITDENIYETLYHIVFGLFASVKENDLDTFSKALKQIQKCEWKKRERDLYDGKIDFYEKLLYNCGATAVAMSSFGPALLFIGEDIEAIISQFRTYQNLNCEIISCNLRNSGRIISVV